MDEWAICKLYEYDYRGLIVGCGELAGQKFYEIVNQSMDELYSLLLKL